MSDGFRISSDDVDNQEDQLLTDANRDELRQNLRQSATSRNQIFNIDSGPGGTDESAEKVSLFKAVLKSPTADHVNKNTQDNPSPSNSEDEA